MIAITTIEPVEKRHNGETACVKLDEFRQQLRAYRVD